MKRNFIFEIQIIRQNYYEERVLYYASKAYSKQLVKSSNYKELQPVYLLSILDHALDYSIDGWLQRFSFINELNTTKKVMGIHLIYLELEKCRKKVISHCKPYKTDGSLFSLNLKNTGHVTRTKHNYPNLIKAVELLDESNYTPGQLIAYDRYLDGIMTWNTTMTDSYDNGFNEGMDKGTSLILRLFKKLNQEKINRRNCKEYQFSIDKIVELKIFYK